MSTDFRGSGDVLCNPILRTVVLGTVKRKIAELQVYFDDDGKVVNGSLRKEGGFCLEVRVWNEMLALEVMDLVKRGARVHVAGRLWGFRSSEPGRGERGGPLYLNADELFLGLTRLDRVEYSSRRAASRSAA